MGNRKRIFLSENIKILEKLCILFDLRNLCIYVSFDLEPD